MKCTLMHRRVEVAQLELDDETGIIRKIESVMSAEHLPVGVPVKGGIADRHELNNGGLTVPFPQAVPVCARHWRR